MKIFITGGTGLIGSHLIPLLLQKGHTITVLTRNVEKAKSTLDNRIEFCESLDTLSSLDRYDAVINLAGEPIAGKRWSTSQKERLYQSRWQITKRLSQLIKASDNPPHVFISGSAVGYYGNKEDLIVTEDTEPHIEFTQHLCQKWEALATEAVSEKTRVCLLRTGIVLSNKGGMLSKIAPIFNLGLGGTMGSGKQYISWIHIDDMTGIIDYLLTATHIKGAVNMTSPNPVTNKEFSATLARVLKRPCLFKVPAAIISLFMGEAATLIIDGQRVIPQKLEHINYPFKYKDIYSALDNLFNDKP